MLDYHLFKKVVTKKNGKKDKQWYYWFYDENGVRRQRSCKGCSIKAEAERYINQLPPVSSEKDSDVGTTKSDASLIVTIAEHMYLPDSDHFQRRKQYGKSVKIDTLIERRRYLDHIIQLFGQRDILTLPVSEIQKTVLTIERSGSWKNSFLEVFSEVYNEALWQGIPVVKPSFQRFVRDSKKCDVFSTDELNRLFIQDNFSSETFFLFFLVCLSAGMRLGEIRAFRAQQYMPEYKSVIIDGFLSQDSKTRNPFNKTGTEANPRFRVSMIPEKTAALLEKYIADNNRTGEEYVFLSSGKPIRQEFAEAEFARAIKKAEIPTENKKFTPHSLRYTFVTRTRRLFDANSVMMMAGHSSIEMSDHYNRPELFENIKTLMPLRDQMNLFFE